MDESKPQPEKPKRPRRRRIQEDPQFLLVQQLRARVKGGGSWFYWIAGLSIINSVIVLFRGDWNFLVGLGATQVVDAIALAIGQEAEPAVAQVFRVIALLIDVSIAGIFVLFGLFANRQKGWAFVLGMVLYGLDGAIFLLAQVWLSFGFHVFALFCIVGGYGALRKLRVAEAAWERAEAEKAAAESEAGEASSVEGKEPEPAEKEIREEDRGPYTPQDFKM